VRALWFALVALGCKGSEPPAPIASSAPAQVAHEEAASGDVRLYSGTIADLDGDGTLELAAGGFATNGGRRRATVFVYRQHGHEWRPLTDGGWLGGGGGNGSTVRNVEVADLDGDGLPEVIALGRVGSKTQAASARLAVLSLRDGTLRELAKIEWNVATYTHGFGLAIGDLDGDQRPEIITTGFLFDGTTEHGFLRTWKFDKSLVMRAETRLAGTAAASIRINDVAIGDLDGDGRNEIVTAGRIGPYRADGTNDDLDARRERGDLAIFDGATLEMRARTEWLEGSSLRLRTVAIANLDGTPAMIAGGQFDSGKPCLAVFALRDKTIAKRAQAFGDAAGEIKDLLVSGTRIIATGPSGAKPARQGDVATWRFANDQHVREDEVVSANGVETRARAAVIGPDGHVMTIGHAKTSAAMVGQVLSWPISTR
jgi:hypothetical protein